MLSGSRDHSTATPYTHGVSDDVQMTLFGIIWDGTFAAALCAALVGIVTLVVSNRQAKAARTAQEKASDELLNFQKDAERRNQRHIAITSATNQALSSNLAERAVGLTHLGSMLDDPWATDADKELILAVGVILE